MDDGETEGILITQGLQVMDTDRHSRKVVESKLGVELSTEWSIVLLFVPSAILFNTMKILRKTLERGR